MPADVHVTFDLPDDVLTINRIVIGSRTASATPPSGTGAADRSDAAASATPPTGSGAAAPPDAAGSAAPPDATGERNC